MAARENEIGRCRCPVCGSKSAALRVSAKGLAYVTCNTCNAQVFARSDASDDKLRALHLPPAATEPAPPAAAPAPAAAPTAPKPAPAPEPASAGPGWRLPW